MCARLRADKRGATIPVILLTANFITADEEVAGQAGADDFVVKPFDPCELMTRVKALAQARREGAPQHLADHRLGQLERNSTVAGTL